MRRKLAPFRPDIKTDEEVQGQFEAIVAVFDNVDLVGDRIKKGAFTKSLEEWEAKGDPIPVIFSHQWDNLDAHVGEVIEAKEVDEGLYIKGQLDLEDDFARKLWNKMKRRRVKEFSFAYDVVEESQEKDANELIELKVIEVGPTLKGANPDTQLLSVKQDTKPEEETPAADAKAVAEAVETALKAGRVLSSKNETKIADAVKMLQEVLASVATADPDGKAIEPVVRLNPADVRAWTEVAEAV